ncbi:MAG: hypothetical protein LBI13_03420 [Streptococcaceae bacterium]|jgi:hypothetical protein|nr:hypothetical protein [Streptococcaceae bacterium]
MNKFINYFVNLYIGQDTRKKNPRIESSRLAFLIGSMSAVCIVGSYWTSLIMIVIYNLFVGGK